MSVCCMMVVMMIVMVVGMALCGRLVVAGQSLMHNALHLNSYITHVRMHCVLNAGRGVAAYVHASPHRWCEVNRHSAAERPCNSQ